MNKAVKTDYAQKIDDINKHIEKLENEKRIINGKLKVLKMQKDELKSNIKK